MDTLRSRLDSPAIEPNKHEETRGWDEGMVIIFGHTGFIGREICHRLKESGYMVTGFSSKQCDLLDYEAVYACLADLPRPFDILNCAVINRSSCYNLDGLEKNLLMFRNILKAIPAGGCRSFIQLSSMDVYGHKPTLPVNEDSPVRPATYYAMAKLDCEWLLDVLSTKDFPSAVLRLPGVYGPGDQGRSVIGKLLRQAANRESIDLTNGGTALRDYLLIDDLYRVIRLLLDDPRQLLVNLVTGQSTPLREILEIVFEKTGTRGEVRFTAAPATQANDLVFDNSRCREYFPGFDFTGLAEGIEMYADEHQATGGNS